MGRLFTGGRNRPRGLNLIEEDDDDDVVEDVEGEGEGEVRYV